MDKPKRFWHIDFRNDRLKLPYGYEYPAKIIFLSNYTGPNFSLMHDITDEDVTYLALLGVFLKEETDTDLLIDLTTRYHNKYGKRANHGYN